MAEKKKRALLSVYTKDGLEKFAQGLVELGYAIVSSGGTAKYLQNKGFVVTDVAEITGVPAFIGHRVVTLHPKIHGGILALKTPEHEADLEKYGIKRFDLVCVDLYPVREVINKGGATPESVMEMTDIGGPTLLRGAAKNHENVIVICDPADRMPIIKRLKEHGDINLTQRRYLAKKVFETMSAYDGAISEFLWEAIDSDIGCE